MVIIRMVMTTTMQACECTKLCNLVIVGGCSSTISSSLPFVVGSDSCPVVVLFLHFCGHSSLLHDYLSRRHSPLTVHHDFITLYVKLDRHSLFAAWSFPSSSSSSSSSHCFRALVACQISIIIISSISCIIHPLIGFGQHQASGPHPHGFPSFNWFLPLFLCTNL